MPAGRLVRSARILAVTAVAGTTTAALAAPPVDAGAAARGGTAVDRALESRTTILDRSGVSGRAAGDASTRGSVRYDNGGMVAGPATTGAEVAGSASAGATSRGTTTAGAARTTTRGNAGVSNDLRSGAAATFDLDRLTGTGHGHASPLGRGRLGAEMRADGVGQARVETRGARGGATVDNRGGLRLGLGGNERSDRPDRSLDGNAGVDVEAAGAARVGLGRGRGVRPERVLSQADAHLAKRLAQIDRMRDRAVETGDELLLQQADKLELLARAQFEQRTTGEARVGATMKTYHEARRDADAEPTDEAAPAPSDPAAPEPAPSPVETTANIGAEVEANATAGSGGAIIQTSGTADAGATVE